MIKSAVILILVCCATLSTAKSQLTQDTLNYNIELSGANIGKMQTIRSHSGAGKIQYTLISNVKVNALFFKVKVSYVVKSYYENDVLQSATVDTKANKGVFHSEIYKENGLYVVKAHQYRHDLETTQVDPIKYSVAKSFF